ncbi:MAG TPA: rhodanese-like domain-containing protein [Bacteroidetes bacterium]|nr:rhodanese-like domain-containing protein [Bacteroidota bacterium]
MDITAKELKEKLERGDHFLFIDVREKWEHEKSSLGAQNIPLNQLIKNLSELASYKNEEIVVHCQTGQRSGMVKLVMKAAGFTQVRNLIGGIEAFFNV